MNYRLVRKKNRMSLTETALKLGVTPGALRHYEHGIEPWPQGLREKYLVIILDTMHNEHMKLWQ